MKRTALLLFSGLVFFCSLLLTTNEVQASHYRGGTLTYKQGTGLKVTFTLEVFFRRSFGSWCPKPPASCVGRTIKGLKDLFYGDGKKVPVTAVVTADDKASDIITLKQTFTYTYAKAGTYSVYWSGCCWVTNAAKQSNWTLRIVVQPGSKNNNPVVNSPTLFQWCTKAAFVTNVNASDPDGDPLTYKFEYGPKGMKLDNKGNLTWNPPVKGLWAVGFQVLDNKGATTHRQFMLNVKDNCPNNPPVLSVTPASANIKPGQKTCTTVKGSDKDTAQKLTYVVSVPATGTSTGVPSGVQTNPSTFQYCWQSTLKDEGKTLTVLFTVKDTGTPQLFAQKSFRITVGKGVAPTLTLSPAITAWQIQEGATKSLKVTAKDPDGNGIASLKVTGLPAFCQQKLTGTTVLDITCKPGFKDGGKTATLVFTTVDKDGIPKTATATVNLSVLENNRAPSLTLTPATTTIQEGQNVKVVAKASDLDGDKLTFKTSTLPAGMLWKVVGNEGTLTWTPGTTQSGTYKITVTVTDDGKPNKSVSKVLTLVVTNLNLPPKITSTPPTSATEDKVYSYAAKASDPDAGDILTWSLGQAPSGAKIDSKTGVFTWTPGDKEAGQKVTLSILVCDSAKQCAQQKWVVSVTNVNDTPKITSKPGTSVNEKTSYSYNPTAVDPDTGDSLTWSLTKQPGGAQVDRTTGRVTWNAGLPGKDGEFTLKVCDKAGACSTQSWKVVVKDVNEAPKITSTPPAQASERKVYSYNPKVVDPDAADQGKLVWKLLKDPGKSTFDTKTGALQWTPTAQDVKAGSVSFSIQVCDPKGACDTQTWTVKINNVNDAPRITSTPPTIAYVGRRYRYVPTATDPDGDKLTWKLKKGPSNVQFDSNNGSLNWTPAKADAGKLVDLEIEVCDNGQPQKCTSQTVNVLVRLKCLFDVDCPGNEICTLQEGERICYKPTCDATNLCPKGKICKNGQCIETNCMKNGCKSDEICRSTDGKCIKPCKGVTCKVGQFCADGACVKDPCAGKCKAGEVCDSRQAGKATCLPDPCTAGSCKAGRICPARGIAPCMDDPCLSMTCPKADQRCLAGQCIDRPTCVVDVDCPSSQVCVKGRCALAGCYDSKAACTGGKLCLSATCSEDTCKNATCKSGEFCRPGDGKCAKPCAGVSCKDKEVCVDGACVKDACAGVTCKAGQVCASGKCEYFRCNASNVCRYGRVCNSQTNRCEDDRCKGVKCPDSKQVCAAGQCVSPSSCLFDKDCPGSQLCLKGKCVTPDCSDNKDCKDGELCDNGKCAQDPCAGKKCDDGKFCRLGQCIRTCAGVFCKDGEQCIDGRCLADACASLTCQQDEVCINGRCVESKCAKDSCKAGRACQPTGCVSNPCNGVVCGKNQRCQEGICVGDRFCTVDKDCPGSGVCINDTCTAAGCYDGGCKAGELCMKGKCVADPCKDQDCNEGFYCRPGDGTCVRSCPVCPEGKRCVNGFCESDPCAGVTCKDGERCVEGQCKVDRCLQSATPLCKAGRVCSDSKCEDDGCDGVKCPGGRACRDGVCTRAPDVQEEPDTEPTVDTTGDGGSKESGKSSDRLAELPPVPGGEGCGCTQIPSPSGFLLLLILVPLWWRRRR